MVRINSATIRQILRSNAQKAMHGRKVGGEKASLTPKELQSTTKSRGDLHSAAGHWKQPGKQIPRTQGVCMNSQFLPQCTDSSSSYFRGSKRHFSHQPNQHAYYSSQSYNRPACVLYGTPSLNPYLYNAAGPVYMYPHPHACRTMGYSTQHTYPGSSRGRGLHHSQNHLDSGRFSSHANVPTHVPLNRYSSSNVAQTAFKKPETDVEEIYDTETLSSQARSHVNPEDGNIQRLWEYTEYGRAHMTRPKPGVEFSILSYNILCQQLLEDNSYLYPHCSEDVLDWENRRIRLLQEILSYNPDVLCLQEVQENHYKDFFRPQLCDQGYEGVFQKRTGDKPDGCAIFVKSETLKISEFFPIIYNRGDLLDKDNVALIAKLKAESQGEEAEVFVATTHLLFNPRRGDIKLAQLSLLFAELDKLARMDSRSAASHYSPIVLCGDFNTEPHSDIYNFVLRGYIQYEGLMCRKLSGQEDGNRGREIYLGKQLLPQHVKITDQCQYLNTLKKRNVKIPENVSRIFKSESRPISVTSEENKCHYANKTHSEACIPRETTSDKSGPSRTSNDESDLPLTDSELSTCNKVNRINSPTVSYSTGCLWHKLNLVSAYKHTIERLWHSADEVTTQHKNASCTLDYIFYNVGSKQTHTKKSRVVTRNIEEDKLRLIGRYGLLSSREVKNMGGLPNKYLASDHLGLLTKFLLQYR